MLQYQLDDKVAMVSTASASMWVAYTIWEGSIAQTAVTLMK